MHYKYMNFFSSLDLPIQYRYLPIINLYYTVLTKKENLAQDFIEHKRNSQNFQNSKLFIPLEKT